MVMLFVKSESGNDSVDTCDLGNNRRTTITLSSFKSWMKILFLFVWLFCSSAAQVSIRHRCIRNTLLHQRQEEESSSSAAKSKLLLQQEQQQQKQKQTTREHLSDAFTEQTWNTGKLDTQMLPRTLLQQLSNLTICDECHVEIPPGTSSQGDKKIYKTEDGGRGGIPGSSNKEKLSSATIFLPPWYTSSSSDLPSHSNLLSIAGELLQKGMYVTLLRIQYYTNNHEGQPHGDNNNSSSFSKSSNQSNDHHEKERKWLWTQVMSALPCDVIQKNINNLSIQFETLVSEATITSKHASPKNNNDKEKADSKQQHQYQKCTAKTMQVRKDDNIPSPIQSPYHPCSIEYASQIYRTLRIRYLQMLTKFPNETVLPDVFVMEASFVGGMLLAEKLRVLSILLAPPSILPLIATPPFPTATAHNDVNVNSNAKDSNGDDTTTTTKNLGGSRTAYRLGPFQPPPSQQESLSSTFFPSFLLINLRRGHMLLSWLKHLLEDRMQSLWLTHSFIRLNQLRRNLGLRTIHSPGEYFDAAAIIIADAPPKFEQFRALPEYVHLVGPLIPQCVPCSTFSMEQQKQQQQRDTFSSSSKRGSRNSNSDTSKFNNNDNKNKQQQQMIRKKTKQDYNNGDTIEDDEFILKTLNDVSSTNSSYLPLTILVGPMKDLDILQFRALIRALSYARDEIQTYAIGACKERDETAVDNDNQCTKFKSSTSSSQKAGGNGVTMDDITKATCHRRENLMKKQCLRYLQMARFQVIIHTTTDGANSTATTSEASPHNTPNHSPYSTTLPEVLPAFVLVVEIDIHQQSSLLIDSAIHHTETTLVLSSCHEEHNDWREAIVLNIPVICISEKSQQHHHYLSSRVAAQGTKRGLVQVAADGGNRNNVRMFTMNLAKTVMDMTLRVQVRKLKQETHEENAVYLAADAAHLSSGLFISVGEEGVDPVEDVETLAETFLEGGGLKRVASIIRKAAKVHRHAGFWSSEWRSTLNQVLQLNHHHHQQQQHNQQDSKTGSTSSGHATIAEQTETLLVGVSWFVAFVALCIVLGVWDRNVPSWLKRYMQKHCYTPRIRECLLESEKEIQFASQFLKSWYQHDSWHHGFGSLLTGLFGKSLQEVAIGQEGTNGNDTHNNAVNPHANGAIAINKNGHGSHRPSSQSQQQGQSRRGGGTAHMRKRRNGKRR